MTGVGTNRYAYAENDPINKSDPNGHAAPDPRSYDPDYRVASGGDAPTDRPEPTSTSTSYTAGAQEFDLAQSSQIPRRGTSSQPQSLQSAVNGFLYSSNLNAARTMWSDVRIPPSIRAPGSYTTRDVELTAGLVRAMRIVGTENFGAPSSGPTVSGLQAILQGARFSPTPKGRAQWFSSAQGDLARDNAFSVITGTAPRFQSRGFATARVTYGNGLALDVTAYRSTSQTRPLIQFSFKQEYGSIGARQETEVFSGKVRY